MTREEQTQKLLDYINEVNTSEKITYYMGMIKEGLIHHDHNTNSLFIETMLDGIKEEKQKIMSKYSVSSIEKDKRSEGIN